MSRRDIRAQRAAKDEIRTWYDPRQDSLDDDMPEDFEDTVQMNFEVAPRLE